jgi:hypothetical protein
VSSGIGNGEWGIGGQPDGQGGHLAGAWDSTGACRDDSLFPIPYSR